MEEGKWLENQLSLLDSAFASVNLGEEIVKEAVMYSFDVPVSKHFTPHVIRVMTERVRKVMILHPEFRNLSCSAQHQLFERNSIFGVALYGAKIESFKNGSDLHYFMMGSQDVEWHRANYEAFFSDRTMKKLNMSITNQFSGILSKKDLDEYQRLNSEIEDVVKSDVAFKLCLLILVFSSGAFPEVQNLARAYANAVRRQLNNKSGNAALGDVIYCSLLKSVDNIQKLSEIFKRFLVI